MPLTPAQLSLLSAELSATVSTDRWFVILATLTDDDVLPTEGDTSLAHIRKSGLFDVRDQKIFEAELSRVVGCERWCIIFGTLDNANRLGVNARVCNIVKDDLIHVTLERLTFDALNGGHAWVRRFPENESLYQHVARGAYEALERRAKITPSGQVEGQMAMPGGIIVGHGVPKGPWLGDVEGIGN